MTAGCCPGIGDGSLVLLLIELCRGEFRFLERKDLQSHKILGS